MLLEVYTLKPKNKFKELYAFGCVASGSQSTALTHPAPTAMVFCDGRLI